MGAVVALKKGGVVVCDFFKRQPCWLLIGGLVLLIVFLLNQPSGSAEWAMWAQALGTISAVVSGFALNASNRRQERLAKIAFSVDALNLISAHLERVKSLIETRDDNGVPMVAAPQGVDTKELRVLISLARREAAVPLSIPMAVDLFRALEAAEAYADALDGKPQDINDALQRAYDIFAVNQPINSVREAIRSMKDKSDSIKNESLLMFK